MSAIITLATNIAKDDLQYRIVGKFGGGKFWQISHIDYDSPN